MLKLQRALELLEFYADEDNWISTNLDEHWGLKQTFLPEEGMEGFEYAKDFLEELEEIDGS